VHRCEHKAIAAMYQSVIVVGCKVMLIKNAKRYECFVCCATNSSLSRCASNASNTPRSATATGNASDSTHYNNNNNNNIQTTTTTTTTTFTKHNNNIQNNIQNNNDSCQQNNIPPLAAAKINAFSERRSSFVSKRSLHNDLTVYSELQCGQQQQQ
jgi:ATP-dependent 26S proteasome regulatory subunit